MQRCRRQDEDSQRKMSKKYYYVKGEKVPLKEVSDVASVRVSDVEASNPRQIELSAIKSAARKLRGGVSLLDKTKITKEAGKFLKDNKLTSPIFESEGSYLVPLAEVRIEDADPDSIQRVLDWVSKHSDSVEVSKLLRNRVVLRPVSNRADEAIDLANEITENLGPSMAQVRFIRMVQRPTTGPRGEET